MWIATKAKRITKIPSVVIYKLTSLKSVWLGRLSRKERKKEWKKERKNDELKEN